MICRAGRAGRAPVRPLINHLNRGSQLCLLNLVLTCAPLSPDDEESQRSAARDHSAICAQLGPNPNLATLPVYRLPWVCKRVFDIAGIPVGPFDRRHPWYVGRGRINYGWKD